MGKLYTEEDESPDELELYEHKEDPPPMPIHKIILLNISFFGFNAMYLVVCVEAVPAQIEAMVGPGSKARWFGGTVAIGAIVMFLTGPLVGMKSDRLVSKYGRRRPVMFVSMIVLCVALLGAAFSAPEIVIKQPRDGQNECYVDLVAHRCRPYNSSTLEITEPESNMPQTGWIPHGSDDVIIQTQGAYKGNLGLFIVFFLVVTMAMVAFTTPYNALNADKTNPDQRGISSGVMGFMILLGNITGASIGLFFVQMGVFMVYGCVVALVIVCSLITIFCIDEEPGKPVHEPCDWRTIFIGFWEPLKHYDFRWVFITRFLMQQGISTVTGFLEYWLSDMVHIPHCWSTQRALGIILVPMLSTAAIGSISSGVISDKIGRRKILVIVGGLLMFAVATVLASVHGEGTFYAAVVMSFIFGLGFGTYQAVDFALVMDILPSDRDKAKDLAVWHQALILPQALATPIGGVVIDLFEQVNCEIGLGYIMLFVIASIYFLLSALLVLKIKGTN